MKTKNNYPSSEFEHEDKCPSCGSPCNIHTDLDDNDECNECRNQIDGLEMGQIIPKEESKQDLEKEMFELEQELDIPSHLRWHNSKPKQETLEEAAEKYSENWEEITSLDYENAVPSEVNKLDFIKGAKWQKEQNKNLYSEEDMIEFADFYYQYKELIKLNNWETIEVSKEDVFKKWFEDYKNK